MIVKLPPRCLAFYGNDAGWFEELGVKLVDGGVEGTREDLERLARFYTDDADPVQSGIEASMRRNAREAAKRIREQLGLG